MKLSELDGITKRGVREMSDRLLAAAVKKARELYYERGRSPISDASYDRLEEELERRDPKHKLLSAVGDKSSAGRKVKLPYPLYSLTKIKPTNVKAFESWTEHYTGPYVISAKEDGLSLEIVYRGGKPYKAYTRGNGTIGQDVTPILEYIDIPQKVSVKDLAVRCEITMSHSNFRKHGEEAENPRNFVAGLVNKVKGDRSVLQHAAIVALEVIHPRTKPSAGLRSLKAMGFTVVPWTTVPKGKLTLSMLAKVFTERRAKSKRDIDGIVVESDTLNTRPPAGTKSPDYMFAFKMGEADDTAEVKVKSVVWTESKYGTLVPVLHFQPTRLSGVSVTKANGHNAFFIEHGYRQKDAKKGLPKRAIGPGAVVTLTRSGDVIPHVVEVLKGVKSPSMPTFDYTWDAKRVNIKLDGVTDRMRDQRIAAFFTTIGVEGLKAATAAKLAEAGFTTIVKILRASVDDLLTVPGFKERSAQKLHAEIKAKTKQVALPPLMDASGMFGAGLGTRRAVEIVSAYPKLLTEWENLSPKQIEAKVMQIHGFQAKTAAPIGANFHKFLKWLKLTKIKAVLPKTVEVVGKKLKDQAVCFTGFRDKDLEAKIVEQGGRIASGVNRNTTILLYAPGKTSSKVASADKLGIKKYTRDQFITKYRL